MVMKKIYNKYLILRLWILGLWLLVVFLSIVCILNIWGLKKSIASEFEHKPDNFTFVVASDPQPWRLGNGQGNGDPNSDKNSSIWYSIANPTYSSMNNFNSKFLIINGDMTEFGRDSTWDATEKAYHHANMPIFFGLGNHDYANNVNDCSGEVNLPSLNKNYCLANSIIHIYSLLQASTSHEFCHVDNQNYSPIPIVNKDYTANIIPTPPNQPPGLQLCVINGSFSYSFNYGGIHFVELNLYPGYVPNGDDPYHYNNYTIEITSGLKWLEEDLKQAREQGLKIILNYHEPYGADQHDADPDSKSEGALNAKVKELLSKYHVTAVFAGHTHSQSYNADYYDHIPLFISGALFEGDYYVVNVTQDSMTVTAYNGKTGKPEKVPNASYVVDFNSGLSHKKDSE